MPTVDAPRNFGGVVKVTNTGVEPFVDKYNGARYVIPSMQDAIVPFEAACLWFGNPHAVDIDRRRRYRTDEYKRLRNRYGTYDDLDAFARVTPKVELYSMDGERITTVIEDPEGAHLTPQTQTVAENELLRLQMAEMQRNMAAMQARMDAENRAEIASANSDATEDGPPGISPEPVPSPKSSVPLASPKAPVPVVGAREDTPSKVRVG